MEYKRFGSTVVARIDRGEEVLSALKDIALRENIKLATVSALGATDDFTVGVFNVQQKQYHANRFQGAYEIVSLTGTVTTKDGVARVVRGDPSSLRLMDRIGMDFRNGSVISVLKQFGYKG